MLRLVRHVGAEVAADDAVPGCIVFFVKLLLDKGGDVPLVIVLLLALVSLPLLILGLSLKDYRAFKRSNFLI